MTEPEPRRDASDAPTSISISLSKEPVDLTRLDIARRHEFADATTSLASHSQPSLPEKKLDLFFKIRDGTFDWNNPLSSEMLWNSTASEFLDSYSSLSLILPSTFSALALTITFGHRQKLTIRRDASPADWNKLRKRIQTLLDVEKREKPDETEFEIWVERADPN